MWGLTEEYLHLFAAEWGYTPQTVLSMPWVMLVRLTLALDDLEDARWAARHK